MLPRLARGDRHIFSDFATIEKRCASRRRLRNGRDSLAEFERDFPGTESLIVENLRVRACSIASLGCNSEIASLSEMVNLTRAKEAAVTRADAIIRKRHPGASPMH